MKCLLLNISRLFFILNFDKLFVTSNPFDEHNGSNGFQLQRFIRVGSPPGSGKRPTFCTKVMNLSQIYIWISQDQTSYFFSSQGFFWNVILIQLLHIGGSTQYGEIFIVWQLSIPRKVNLGYIFHIVRLVRRFFEILFNILWKRKNCVTLMK